MFSKHHSLLGIPVFLDNAAFCISSSLPGFFCVPSIMSRYFPHFGALRRVAFPGFPASRLTFPGNLRVPGGIPRKRCAGWDSEIFPHPVPSFPAALTEFSRTLMRQIPDSCGKTREGLPGMRENSGTHAGNSGTHAGKPGKVYPGCGKTRALMRVIPHPVPSFPAQAYREFKTWFSKTTVVFKDHPSMP